MKDKENGQLLVVGAISGALIGSWLMRRKKQEGEGDEDANQPYWIMEDGWWWQHVGSYKSNDGGKTWLRIDQRWENDVERERRLRDLVEIRDEEGDQEEAGDQEEEEAEEEEEEPERSSAEPEEEEEEREVVQGEPVQERREPPPRLVQALQSSPPFRRPDLRPPGPAVARQQQAAAAAAAKAAAKEAIKKEDAKKSGLRQLAETKIIDCKEKSMTFLEVLGQLKQRTRL